MSPERLMNQALKRELTDPRQALMLYYKLAEHAAMVLRRSLRLFVLIVSMYGLIFALLFGSALSLFFIIVIIGAYFYRPRTPLLRNLGYLAQLGIARCYIVLDAPYKAYRYLEVALVDRPNRIKTLHRSTLALIRGHRDQARAHLEQARQHHHDVRTWSTAWPYYRASTINTGELLKVMQRNTFAPGIERVSEASSGMEVAGQGEPRPGPASTDGPTQIRCLPRKGAPSNPQLLKEALRLEATRPDSALHIYNRVALKPERTKRKLALIFLLLLVPLTLGSVYLIFVFFGLVILLLLYGGSHQDTVARELAPLGAARCYLRTGQTRRANHQLNQIFKRRLPHLRPLYNATVSIGARRYDQVQRYLKQVPLHLLSKPMLNYYSSSAELTRRLGQDLACEGRSKDRARSRDERWKRPAGLDELATNAEPSSAASSKRSLMDESGVNPVVSVITSEGHLDPRVRAGAPDPLTFTIGTRVFHDNLGPGTIQARFAMGRHWRLRVHFDRSNQVHDVISNYVTPLGVAATIETPPEEDLEWGAHHERQRSAAPPGIHGADLAPISPGSGTRPLHPMVGAAPLPSYSVTTTAPLQTPYQVEWLDLITVESTVDHGPGAIGPGVIQNPGIEPGPEPGPGPIPVQAFRADGRDGKGTQKMMEAEERTGISQAIEALVFSPPSEPLAEARFPELSVQPEKMVETTTPSETWPVQWIEADVDDRMAELDQRISDLTHLVLEPIEPSSPQGGTNLQIKVRVFHERAQLFFQVQVQNLSSRPIFDLKVELDLANLQFGVREAPPPCHSLAPGGTGKFRYVLEPTAERANGTLRAKLCYIDHDKGLIVEQPLEARDTDIVWPILADLDTDRKWRELTHELISHKERIDGAPLPPGVLFELVCRILEDLNLRSRRPKLIQTSTFYSGRARFLAQDGKGDIHGVQAEVVGGPLRTRLLLRIYAPSEASLVGLYHLVREELLLRLEVGETSDPVVYQVNGDFIEGSKTEVRDSVVNRWAAGSEA